MQRAISSQNQTAVSVPRGWILLGLMTSSWALAALIWMTVSQVFALL